MRKLIERCPSCGADLTVSELSCVACDTVVRGRFTACSFCRLSPDELRFAELFVASRGNLKELERETGLGYWALRARLDDLVETMRPVPQPSAASVPAPVHRRDVLASVAAGRMTVHEAEARLRRIEEP
jgi:hypothetical protein